MARCARRIRQRNAPQLQVARAKLAVLLHGQPHLDSPAAARQVGRHANWVYTWRKRWATAGFALTEQPGRGRKPACPPRQVALGKALACALPAQREAPLGRSSTTDLARLIAAHPDAPPLRRSTSWRRLDTEARKPWQHRNWRFPRDPQFGAQAGRVLDWYAGSWDGQPSAPEDGVVRADEQTTIPPRPGQAMRVEHEYARGGALASLAAWDVRRGGREPAGRGRCDRTTGIVAFGTLVDRVMQQEPYRSAPRVCWIVDNGSSHRGTAAADRLQARHPTRILVHLPTQASWLNQVERCCSIVQRKVLTPNDFPDLAAVERRLLAFAARYNDTAVPCHWRCTRQQLADRLAALPEHPPPRPA